MTLNKTPYLLISLLISMASCTNDSNLSVKYNAHYSKVKLFDSQHVICNGVMEVICKNDKQALLFKVRDDNSLLPSSPTDIPYTLIEYGNDFYIYKGKRIKYIKYIKYLNADGSIIDYSDAHLSVTPIKEINITNKDVLDKEMQIAEDSDCNSTKATHNTSVLLKRVDKNNNLINQEHIYPAQLCEYQSFINVRP